VSRCVYHHVILPQGRSTAGLFLTAFLDPIPSRRGTCLLVSLVNSGEAIIATQMILDNVSSRIMRGDDWQSVAIHYEFKLTSEH
jgi:hypothetical protein